MESGKVFLFFFKNTSTQFKMLFYNVGILQNDIEVDA